MVSRGYSIAYCFLIGDLPVFMQALSFNNLFEKAGFTVVPLSGSSTIQETFLGLKYPVYRFTL